MRIKKIISSLLILMAFNSALKAQENIIYTVVFNSVPETFNYPLIGMVNAAHGSHIGVQLGFVNWNQNTFSGAQIGFINANGENLKGSQIGFINVTKDSVSGLQLGFINSTWALNGLTLSFVNIIDTVRKGVPFGFLSIVKKGGFRAIETSFTESNHINISFKVGVKKMYTTYTASYNKNMVDYFSFGIGLGSIIPVKNTFYFNPEILTQQQLSKNNFSATSCTLNFGVRLINKLHFSLGPSLVWQNATQSENLNKEVFSLKKWNLDSSNNLLTGIRLGIKYVFTG